MEAKFLSLGSRDLIKGAIVTALSTVLTAAVTMLNAGGMPTVTDLKTIGVAGLSAGIAYLLKNFVTNSKGDIGKVEPK
jgi:hypothetical protein